MSRVRSHGFITSEDESERENPPKRKRKKGVPAHNRVYQKMSAKLLHLLCNKVEQVLKEIQIARWSIVYY